jgi:hypothetical protein
MQCPGRSEAALRAIVGWKPRQAISKRHARSPVKRAARHRGAVRASPGRQGRFGSRVLGRLTRPDDRVFTTVCSVVGIESSLPRPTARPRKRRPARWTRTLFCQPRRGDRRAARIVSRSGDPIAGVRAAGVLRDRTPKLNLGRGPETLREAFAANRTRRSFQSAHRRHNCRARWRARVSRGRARPDAPACGCASMRMRQHADAPACGCASMRMRQHADAPAWDALCTHESGRRAASSPSPPAYFPRERSASASDGSWARLHYRGRCPRAALSLPG